MAGLAVVNLRRIPLDDPGAEVLKRLGDVLGALLLIALTAPLMLAAAVGTRLSSPGPVIFVQERLGRDKKPFRMYKAFSGCRSTCSSPTPSRWSA